MITRKAYCKGECPQIKLLMLKDYEVSRKNIKIVYLEKKWKKRSFNTLANSSEGRILEDKIGIIKKIPKNS
jgi:hypothetical protein